MTLSQTNEQAFECLIEKALVGSTVEERKAAGNEDIDAQHPGPDQYYWGRPKDMPSKLAIDERRLWSFLESTQKDVLAEYRGKDLQASVERQIFSDISTFGIIKVIIKLIQFMYEAFELFRIRAGESMDQRAQTVKPDQMLPAAGRSGFVKCGVSVKNISVFCLVVFQVYQTAVTQVF